MVIKMETSGGGSGINLDDYEQLSVNDVNIQANVVYDTNITAQDGQIIFLYHDSATHTKSSTVAYVKNGAIEYIVQNTPDSTLSVSITNGNIGISHNKTNWSPSYVFYLIIGTT